MAPTQASVSSVIDPQSYQVRDAHHDLIAVQTLERRHQEGAGRSGDLITRFSDLKTGPAISRHLEESREVQNVLHARSGAVLDDETNRLTRMKLPHRLRVKMICGPRPTFVTGARVDRYPSDEVLMQEPEIRILISIRRG